MATQSDIRWFKDLRLEDVGLVGGKTASLGELYGALAGTGVLVPNGFALTSAAYREALAEAGADVKLHKLLDDLDKDNMTQLEERAKAAREIVHAATGGVALRAQIVEAYRTLEKEAGRDVAVAVRSSATAEDLPTASFAGQHDSYLNIRGEEAVVEACRRCLPIARSSTGSTTASIISKWRFRSRSCAWCARTWAPAA
jgi:pyruvate,water dikinase